MVPGGGIEGEPMIPENTHDTATKIAVAANFWREDVETTTEAMRTGWSGDPTRIIVLVWWPGLEVGASRHEWYDAGRHAWVRGPWNPYASTLVNAAEAVDKTERAERLGSEITEGPALEAA